MSLNQKTVCISVIQAVSCQSAREHVNVTRNVQYHNIPPTVPLNLFEVGLHVKCKTVGIVSNLRVIHDSDGDGGCRISAAGDEAFYRQGRTLNL